MALDSLPGQILVPTRDELVAKWKRDFRIRAPSADTSDGTQPDIAARIQADSLLPIFAAAKTIGDNCVLERATGAEAVAQWGAREGVDGPNAAIGASGYVRISASAGGTFIVAGDQLIHEPTRTKYQVTLTATYLDGIPCPIVGIDTGPSTNLAAGSVLKWVSARPGSGQTVTVNAQSDGSGLSGGRIAETTVEFRERIRQEKREKPASGNDADYRATTAKTPGIAVQAVFTYPAIDGASSTSVCFTLPPSRSGGSRVPNSAQVAAAEAYVAGVMPADDSAFFCLIHEELADVVFSATWDQDAAGWADIVQWPPYYVAAGTPAAIVVSAATDPTHFTLAASNYTAIAQPQVGQTIAFFDTANGRFVKKRILGFTGTGPWVITVDTTNNASDTLYKPVAPQRAMPWSESLPAMLPPLFAYSDSLGPGEMVAVFYDEGRRQRRQPQAPKDWPYAFTRKGLEAPLDIAEVGTGDVLEGDGVAASVGSPGVYANILRLRYVSVFPE